MPLLRHHQQSPRCSTVPARSTFPAAPLTRSTTTNILAWIAQSPNPFPTQLRAGRIKYYGSIPTAITGNWPSYGSTDQRFWVEFIDYVLGFRQTSAGNYQDISGMAGYGSDFTWGTTASRPPAGRAAVHELHG